MESSNRLLILLLLFLLSGCGGGGGGDSSDVAAPVSNGGDDSTVAPSPVPQPAPVPDPVDPGFVDVVPQLTGFPRVSEEGWDEVAVRKVLRTFAYGGQALDSQITAWADMPPAQAIAEMLTFDEHNLKLSPVGPQDTDRLDTRDGTLLGLSEFWTSDDPANGVYPSIRHIYGQQNPHLVWTKAATSRGLNPFRQKIGLWETNYHMATNVEAGVPRNLMFGYYDAIMSALEQGLPYQDVLTVAATSPAVATQYGHRYNVFVNGKCFCNEDFAREYHQLFFGILGDYNPALHETVSIKNTAAALTDMKVQPDGQGGLLNSITYGTGYHFPGLLQILNVDIGGVNAFERINELSQYAIAHPESLANLPVIIIRGLADENLTDSKIQAIRTAWASLAEKNLLDFLRAYAISTLFHDESRIKYWTSIDRHVLIANQITLNNEEGYLNLYDPGGFEDEDVQPFHPRHNVFGGQTGVEAADSSEVFRNNYNRVTEGEFRYRRAATQKYGRTWEKDWGSVIPSESGQQHVVWKVAEWLWSRFIGDGLKNFGTLERMHVYALLARGTDFAYLADPDNPDRVVTELDLNADADLQSLLANLGNKLMALNSADASERLYANENTGRAINFIVGTPYMFLDEGV